MTDHQKQAATRALDILGELAGGLCIVSDHLASAGDAETSNMLSGMRRLANVAAGDLDVALGIARP